VATTRPRADDQTILHRLQLGEDPHWLTNTPAQPGTICVAQRYSGGVARSAQTATQRRTTPAQIVHGAAKRGPKPKRNADLTSGWSAQTRIAFLVDRLGGVRPAAAMLGVSPSQVSRWARGERVPDGDVARRLIDLDHVVAHASLVWGASTIPGWLTTPNGFLDDEATPIEWIAAHGTAAVIEALEAEMAGAFV